MRVPPLTRRIFDSAISVHHKACNGANAVDQIEENVEFKIVIQRPTSGPNWPIKFKVGLSMVTPRTGLRQTNSEADFASAARYAGSDGRFATWIRWDQLSERALGNLFCYTADAREPRSETIFRASGVGGVPGVHPPTAGAARPQFNWRCCMLYSCARKRRLYCADLREEALASGDSGFQTLLAGLCQ